VAIASAKNWDLMQDDAKAAYLNAVLPKEKWIKLPDGTYVIIKKCLY
jgi:hypothetical protein